MIIWLIVFWVSAFSCVLVDGKWVYGDCSTTCGTGIQIRTNATGGQEEKNCTNNQDCPGNKKTQLQVKCWECFYIYNASAYIICMNWINNIFFVVFQILTIVYGYGLNRLSDNVYIMTGSSMFGLSKVWLAAFLPGTVYTLGQ